MHMAGKKKDEGLAWHVDRGKNTRSNRSESYENLPVKGYTRADGKVVKHYTRRSPVG